MQFRRMMGVAAITLTLFTVGCSSNEEGAGETTTPPAETQTAAPAGGMGTQGTTSSDAPAATASDAPATTHASDAGASHSGH